MKSMAPRTLPMLCPTVCDRNRVRCSVVDSRPKVGVEHASAATRADVMAHNNGVQKLGLTVEQQQDLVEYLKSL